ncbi:MAG: thiamine diphosphokinase [Lachnospiraceae bacterium]|nr:thiamine diphosphokinase [Lachnospiraceae bacterium]
MKRCVIAGAAPIKRYDRIKSLFSTDDFFIFCDGGLKHRESLGVTPDLILGDFDSFEKPENTDTEVIVLPTKKDDTDTAYAVKEALKRGFEEFLLIGVLGERADHSLGNLGLLLQLSKMGKKAMIADDHSELEIVTGLHKMEIPASFSYFSVLAIGGEARGVTIEGAAYPVKDACFCPEIPLGVSNEVAEGGQATVSVREGSLLVVRVVF